MVVRRCVDCQAEGITTLRKIALNRSGNPVPGPRCSTHHRARRAKARDLSWEKRLMLIYGISAEEYWLLYGFQSGKCYICQRATGARKRLSVDHCHASGRIRGLLCGPCNRDVLGHLRDNPDALGRAIDYLRIPPAFAILGHRVVPDFEEE